MIRWLTEANAFQKSKSYALADTQLTYPGCSPIGGCLIVCFRQCERPLACIFAPREYFTLLTQHGERRKFLLLTVLPFLKAAFNFPFYHSLGAFFVSMLLCRATLNPARFDPPIRWKSFGLMLSGPDALSGLLIVICCSRKLLFMLTVVMTGMSVLSVPSCCNVLSGNSFAKFSPTVAKKSFISSHLIKSSVTMFPVSSSRGPILLFLCRPSILLTVFQKSFEFDAF